MSNQQSGPADDDAPESAPTPSGARPAKPTSPATPAAAPAVPVGDPAPVPAVPPADAERIAAARAAAGAGEPELSAPASSGLGSGTTGSDVTPQPGEPARDQPVAGNEPVLPAGPTPVAGARTAPSADPLADPADGEPAPAAPATHQQDAAAAPAAAPAVDVPVSDPADPVAAHVPATPAPVDHAAAMPTDRFAAQPDAAVEGATPTDRFAAQPGAAGGGASPARVAPPASEILASDPADPVAPQVPDDPEDGNGGGARKIVIGVLIVLLIGAAAYGAWYLTRDPATAEAGDCVSVTAQDDNRADVESLDCGADEASYKVGKVLEAVDATCPEEGLYTEIAPAGGDGGYKLCLLPNMAEGACYKADDASGFVKTECTGPETIKVTKVVRGSTDLLSCPDSSGMSYPEPAVTYCLAPAEL